MIMGGTFWVFGFSDFIQVGRITFNFTQHYSEKMSEQMRNP